MLPARRVSGSSRPIAKLHESVTTAWAWRGLTTRILTKLADHGVRGTVIDEETPLLFFTDPDGILVQLQDEHYCNDLGGLAP